MDKIHFVFVDHFSHACSAAAWFALGAVLAFFLGKWSRDTADRIASWLSRLLLKLFGSRPGLVRTAATIFLYNGIVMFIYLSSGLRQVIPCFIAFVSGSILTLCSLAASREPHLFQAPVVSAGGWRPSSAIIAVCAIATVLLELPCFWYSIGMGISLGEQTARAFQIYGAAWRERALAYAQTLLPLLAISACCESVAILGASLADGRRP